MRQSRRFHSVLLPRGFHRCKFCQTTSRFMMIVESGAFCRSVRVRSGIRSLHSEGIVHHTGEDDCTACGEWTACPIAVKCGRMPVCEGSVFCGLYVNGLEGYIDLNEFFSVSGHRFTESVFVRRFRCFAPVQRRCITPQVVAHR